MLKRLLTVTTLLIVLFAGVTGLADVPSPSESVTLMGLLHEWVYPESKFQGGEMSDAAVTGISAIKSKAIHSTPDPFEKVMAHYLKKLNVDADGQSLNDKQGQKTKGERSVIIQQISKESPSHLVIIHVNGPNSSTTLVLSRSVNDALTQIAWLDYRQIAP